MPRETTGRQAVNRGRGLYLVLYDTNTYAGPCASFLGCSPYQFAVRSSNSVRGPGVHQGDHGHRHPPLYHNAYQA
jgi:acetyl-CoA carboxylase carboxyl transferase subunit beta